MRTEKKARPKLGRPRKFQEEVALEAAMRVFWDKGYEGASLRDLTTAMGIDRKSMYLSFGDKEALFLKALNLYSATQLSYLPKALAKPTLREFVDEVFNSRLEFWADKSHPDACMTVQSFAVGDEALPIKQAMIDWRDWGKEQIRKRAEKARKQGDMPANVKPDTFANYFACILAGLTVLAANGASTPQIERTVAMFRDNMPIKMDPR